MAQQNVSDPTLTLLFEPGVFREHSVPPTFLRSMNSWTFWVAVLAIFAVCRVVVYMNDLRTVSHFPGIRCALSPFVVIGSAIPSTFWNPGLKFAWIRRFQMYQKYNSETISIVPFIFGRTLFVTSSVEVARQVLAAGPKSEWIKPPIASGNFDKWGDNVFSSNGEMWQRHRRIMSPAFTTEMYQLVWEESLKTYHGMKKHEGWANQQVVDVHDTESFTKKAALLIISACGFGLSTSWSAPQMEKDADGNENMPVSEALRVEADMVLLSLYLPKWLHSLPLDAMRIVKRAQEKLGGYMKTQVVERKADVRVQLALKEDGARDIFSLLVRANEIDKQGAKLTLDDDELIGNVFFMLIAGHETTAKTLAATFALLALHRDIQEEVYQQIMDVVGPDGDPKFEDYSKLDKALFAFYEASRMFPAPYFMPREATRDTVLAVPNSPGTPGYKSVPIKKGTWVTVDNVGLQYNPQTYSEPEKFKPSRWRSTDTYKAEEITSFSIGPRNCIGRRFASMEGVALLTLWLRDWYVEPLLQPGETEEMWREKVWNVRVVLTLGVADVPLRMRHRTHA